MRGMSPVMLTRRAAACASAVTRPRIRTTTPDTARGRAQAWAGAGPFSIPYSVQVRRLRRVSSRSWRLKAMPSGVT